MLQESYFKLEFLILKRNLLKKKEKNAKQLKRALEAPLKLSYAEALQSYLCGTGS